MATINLGMVTAYAYAKEGGYTGTEAQFETLLANVATTLNEFENFSATAQTLAEGASATASYSGGILTLGIPKGDTGATGNGISTVTLNGDYTLTITFTDGTSTTTGSVRGETGATPNLTIGTVTTGEVGADAAATITGTTDDPVLNLTLPRGATGDVTNLADTFSSSTAYTAGEYVIYNDLLYVFTADHAAGAWTGSDAEQVTVGEEMSSLKDDITNITGNSAIPVTASNSYIPLNGSTVTMSDGYPVITSGGTLYSVSVVACTGGDKFTINGHGGSSTRLWGFIDSLGNVLDVASANASATDLFLTAPTNSAFLIIHTNDGKTSYTGHTLVKVVSDMGTQLSNVSNTLKYSYSLDWVSGVISRDTGVISSSTTRISTRRFLPFNKKDNITIGTGAKYSVRLYDQNYKFLYASQYTWLTTSGTFEDVLNGSITLNGTEKFIKIVLAYSDDATISDINALSALCAMQWNLTATEVHQASEKASSYDVSGNNLLGNVTIRAAKTVNFSDGTQPINEWYLLQDIRDNFYMSKDLKSKKFVFNFKPPVSTTENWSFGIDADNNIYCIVRASALASSPTLDDDNRTVNPYVLLSSEGYSTLHEIDLGANLKPVGWLGNYGWCVLPNKDIIMCEYTRPNVATCNVWHIDGSDATDPDNWDVTWSHAIVSTEDSDSGMKHCHCVQYDFFADVCYFGTGDSDVGSYVYHSKDNGLNWTLTYGPNKKKCRMLTFVFTRSKVYWASDSYDIYNHYFFTADRVNDVIDIENATEIALGAVNKQACYGCAYIQSLGLIVLMDRNDATASEGWEFILQGYDLGTNTIVELGRIKPLEVNAGFRALFIDWYPIDNHIAIGFSPVSSTLGININLNAVCGNQFNNNYYGDGSDRINNLVLSVYKANGNYLTRFDTIYV